MAERSVRRSGGRVTAADVARSLGLSRATVGFVLNDTPGQTISEATRARVLAEADRLGYRPHSAARALASGRSHLVILVLPDWPVDHSMRAHLDEAATVLDRAGYAMVTTTPHADGRAQPLWQTLAPDVVLTLAPISDDVYAQIQASGAATAVAGRDQLATGERLQFAEGPRLQVAHLVERGRRAIAFAGPADPRLADLASQRQELAAITHQELTGSPLAAVSTVYLTSAPTVVADWVAAGVDGVVAYNDDVAAAVLSAALRQGVEVPARLAVVGHDDAPIAALLVPALSTVRIDTAGLGRFLAELALSLAEGTEAPVAGPAGRAELVVRETS